ncbi:MAG: hypothetical protein RLY89_802, partial [Bacteroidota bacterium]
MKRYVHAKKGISLLVLMGLFSLWMLLLSASSDPGDKPQFIPPSIQRGG